MQIIKFHCLNNLLISLIFQSRLRTFYLIWNIIYYLSILQMLQMQVQEQLFLEQQMQKIFDIKQFSINLHFIADRFLYLFFVLEFRQSILTKHQETQKYSIQQKQSCTKSLNLNHVLRGEAGRINKKIMETVPKPAKQKFIIISAYILMQNTDALPIWMGGHGQSLNMVKKYPGINASQSLLYWMKVFYICQFGKHFSRTFTHICIKPQGKFYEMALHHVLSVYLIVFSYLTNFWLFGIIVLFVHDISDFFLIAARIYREVRKRKQYILNTFYVLGMAAWIYFRIFGLAGCCIYPAFYVLFAFDYRTDFLDSVPLQIVEYYQYILFLPGLFMAVMMSILLVLQLFWTYYIGQSFIATTISQKITQHKYD